MSRSLAALAATAAAALPAYAGPLSASAGAAPVSEQASLHASFTPDRLGASTTIAFGFHLQTADGLAPPPLTSVVLHMPAGMNYTLTTLGLSICRPATLQARGVAGCPPNSRIGSGSALVEVPFGTGSGHEIPEIQAVVGPSNAGNMVVLFYANGQTPVFAQLVFAGEVLPDGGAFGSQLATTVPLIPSVPNGPDVSIVNVNATIGPAGLTYYRHVHGRLRPFHPLGIGVPEHCSRGGFPFSATFAFQDGSTASAATTVPCPPKAKPKPKRRK
ncbi:MAG TPA: hypothetical protein VGI27_04485 [Solirubrobacteraceae bacterium]|jgi:hypothetical protein